MPSPFPGMDPYLEDPDVFPNLHDKFIVYLEEFLQPCLPEPYYAKTAQRAWIESADKDRYPDMSVLIGAPGDRGSLRDTGGVATIPTSRARPLTIAVDDLPWDEYRETFLEIYTKISGSARLVTAIEVLSPINKAPGAEARGMYLKKQHELLNANVNLIEIDLLRRGAHTTAVPKRELVARYGQFDYHVCTHCFDRRMEYDVFPFELPEKLPVIQIPLLPEDGRVDVDLQAVFNRCYETGAYPREVNYASEPPPPALSPERLAWVKSVLATRQQPA
jgi:hypothetical protein